GAEDRPELQVRRSAGPGWRLEGVVEPLQQRRSGGQVAVAGEWTRIGKTAQVVESADVIGMSVGIQYRVDAAEPVAQRLRAQLRGGVHEHRGIAVLDVNRGASALVARIVRETDGALAGDRRYPV